MHMVFEMKVKKVNYCGYVKNNALNNCVMYYLMYGRVHATRNIYEGIMIAHEGRIPEGAINNP